jgi:hypothetical protein
MNQERYAVVALFAPATLGATIARSAWPAHVTVVSNFAVEEACEGVVRTVESALTGSIVLEARLAGPAMFGPHGDVPVQLVHSSSFREIHERLAAAVEHLPRFVADEPEYWHHEYRPHITRRIGETLQEGETWPVHCFATVVLTERHGTIIGVVDVARL